MQREPLDRERAEREENCRDEVVEQITPRARPRILQRCRAVAKRPHSVDCALEIRDVDNAMCERDVRMRTDEITAYQTSSNLSMRRSVPNSSASQRILQPINRVQLSGGNMISSSMSMSTPRHRPMPRIPLFSSVGTTNKLPNTVDILRDRIRIEKRSEQERVYESRCEQQTKDIKELSASKHELEVQLREIKAQLVIKQAQLEYSESQNTRSLEELVDMRRLCESAEDNKNKVALLEQQMSENRVRERTLLDRHTKFLSEKVLADGRNRVLTVHKSNLSSKISNLRRSLMNCKRREKHAKTIAEKLSAEAKLRTAAKTERGHCKSYEDLTDSRSKHIRFRELLASVEKFAHSTDSKVLVKFLKDFSSWYAPQEFDFAETLSPIDSLVFLRQFDISWNRYAKMRKLLNQLCGRPVLASVHSVRKQNAILSSKKKYESFDTEITVKDVKISVPVVELTDLKSMLNSRVQSLYDSGKLLEGAQYNDNLFISIIGDKGGNETRLCLQIGNVERSNSRDNLLLCGCYKGDDKREWLSQCLKRVIAEINSLKTVNLQRDGVMTELKIEWFLAGDFAFLYQCLGHVGATSSYSCLFCSSPRCRVLEEFDLNATHTPRTLATYLEHARTGKLSVAKQSTPIFTCVDIDHVIPPSLHIFMGVGELSFDALKAEASAIDCELAQNGDSISQQRKTLTAKKKELKNLKNCVAALEKDMKTASVALEVFRAFETRTVTPPSAKILQDEPECAAAPICLMRDKRMHASDNCMWTKCVTCKRDYHYECAGMVSSETIARANSDGMICFSCGRVKFSERITLVETEITEIRTALDTERKRETELAAAVAALDSSLNGGVGAKMRELDNMFKLCGGDSSAWFQTFNGNQTRKLLQNENVDKLWSIFPDSERKTNFSKYMRSICELQNFAKARFLSEDEIETMPALVTEMIDALKLANPALSVPPKLHALALHVPDFIARFKTWGIMSEQAIESLHSLLNRLNARYAAIRSPLLRYESIVEAFSFRNYMFDTRDEL